MEAACCGTLEGQPPDKPRRGRAREVLCRHWSSTNGAKEEVEKSGIMIATERGAQKKNPAFEVMSQTAAEMQKIEGEFGMTPSSRGRLKPAEGEGDDSFKGKRLSLNGTRASAQIQRTLPFISESCLFGSVRLMHC